MRKGTKHTAETLEKLRISHLGHKPPKTAFKKGMIPWNKGLKASKEFRKKLSLAHKGKMTGSSHILWKGEKANYRSIHAWVVRWKGKPETCEKCGKSGLKGRYIQWANIDHKYRRVLEDYVRLCTKCHFEYDKFKLQCKKLSRV